MGYKQICVNIDETEHSLWKLQNPDKSLSQRLRDLLRLDLYSEQEIAQQNLRSKIKKLKEELLVYESKLGNVETETSTQREELWNRMKANNSRLTREMFDKVWEKQSEI